MNDRDRHARLHAVFQGAAELSPTERAAYLDRTCDGDDAMRREVDALLRIFDEGTPAPLRSPAPPIPSRRATSLVGQVLGDRYRLTRLIARGGMGTVYAADQIRPVRREVAVKVITPGMDTDQVIARFEAERQTLALMNHPNIARVFDAGSTDEGHPYFVMELVDGTPVTEYCDARAWSVRSRVELFIAVCRGVQHAHQKGVIHRDLKPTNVLVTSAEGGPEPKIIDFGIAKAVEHDPAGGANLTEQRQILGTPEYMSPEQVAGGRGDVDTRSDIYSLGALLYQLLTGTTPLDGTELRRSPIGETLRTIGEVDPARPSTRVVERREAAAARGTEPVALRRALRGDLDWIVMKCLEKERARRYESADALAQDLERHLAAEPVRAGPPGVAYRARKFVRRNRVAVSAAAVIVMALIVGLSATIMALVSTTRSRAELETSLVAQRIEQGRLLGYSGEAGLAGQLLWTEYLRDPDSRHAFWALRELHSRHPRLATISVVDGTAPDTSGHGIVDIAFDPRGARLASVGRDGFVRLWHMPTWRPLAALEGHGAEVFQVQFAPDGATLASGDENGSIIVWDAADQRMLRRLDGHRGAVRSLRFSPDGRTMVSTSDDGTACLWDVRSLELRAVLDESGTVALDSAVFTPDGRLVVIVGWDGPIWLADVEQQRVVARLDGHRDRALALAVSPDGRTLASGSIDKTIRLWDLETRTCTHVIEAGNGSISSLCFINDGRSLLAGGWWRLDTWDVESRRRTGGITAGRVRIIDPSVGLAGRGSPGGLIELWQIDPRPAVRRLPPHDGSAAARLDPDGRVLATGDGAGTVRLWELSTGRLVRRLDGHTGRVRSLDFTPDGAHIAAGADDGSLRLWDTRSGACEATFDGHDDSALASLAFDASGRRLAHANAGGAIAVHDLETGALVTIPATTRQVLSVAFSPDGETLAATCRGRRVQLWDAAGQPLGVFDTRGTPWSLAFDADGRRLAVTTWARRVEIWDVERRVRLTSLEGHIGTVWCVAWHPTDPGMLVSGGDGGKVKIWDVEQERCLETFDAFDRSGVASVQWAPDGRTLIAAGGEGVVIRDLDYFDRHLAGNLAYQVGRLRDELDSTIPEARLAAWADEVLRRPWRGRAAGE